MTTVETTTGTVAGTTERGVQAFKGLPYAAPPVGERRFRPPSPPEPWTGTRDATEFGPHARQTHFDLDEFMGAKGIPTSEADCLTLNVWTPAADDARRPVLVWIHGGAFFSGGAAIPWYHGGGLARRGDAVIVSIQYRLGAFGYLHLEPLLGQELAGSGNAGLLDQVAALEWVRDNIASFGGDPGNVTVFGESAGGFSVGTLLGTPAARGLFHRAIAMSGACQAVSSSLHAAEIAERVLHAAGLTEATAADLLTLDTDALNAAQDRVVAETFQSSVERAGGGNLGMPFQPVLDGHVLPRHPLEAVIDGAAADIPLVLGTTLHEMRLFTLFDPRISAAPPDELARLVDLVFAGSGHSGSEVLAEYRSRRPEASDLDVFNDVLTDHVFRMPAIRLAEAQSAHRPADTRMYRFTWEASFGGLELGAFHGVDLLFAFDNVRMPGMEMFWGDRVEAAHGLGAATSEAFLGHARDADPNHDGLPSWPAYDTAARATMDLGETCRVLEDPGGEDRALWEGII